MESTERKMQIRHYETNWPVSYTHLDVYKRQPTDYIEWDNLKDIPFFLCQVVEDREKHDLDIYYLGKRVLHDYDQDVYKRQGMLYDDVLLNYSVRADSGDIAFTYQLNDTRIPCLLYTSSSFEGSV